jgi:hypothetical protein
MASNETAEESLPANPTLFFRAPRALVARLDAYIKRYSTIPEFNRPKALRLLLDRALSADEAGKKK